MAFMAPFAGLLARAALSDSRSVLPLQIQPPDTKQLPNEWFLVTELILFVVAWVLSTFQAKLAWARSKHLTVACAGSQARPLFLTLISGALFLRVTFLLLGLFVSSTHDGAALWLRVLGRSLPSLVFVSSYSIIVAFWADIYFKSKLVESPLLVFPLLFYLNLFIYTIFTVIAVFTLLNQAYLEFRRYAMFFIGLFYVIVAIAWSYYGLKVVSQLQQRAGLMAQSGRLRRSNIHRRMLVLCVICPLLFFAQGIYNLLVSLNIIHTYYPGVGAIRWYWDGFVYISGEWVPSILIVMVFWRVRRQSHPSQQSTSQLYSPAPENTSYDNARFNKDVYHESSEHPFDDSAPDTSRTSKGDSDSLQVTCMQQPLLKEFGDPLA